MGVLFILLAACLWGSIGPASRFIFDAGLTPLETAFWRGTIAGAAYMLHMIMHQTLASLRRLRPRIRSPRQHRLAIFAFGIFGVALLEGSYVYAVDSGGAALASVLLYSAPIWVHVAGWKLFGETISRKQWFALAVTLTGITGICLWGATISFSTPALIWGLISGLSYALFYIAGRYFFAHTHPVAVYAWAFPVGSLAMLPVLYFGYGLTPWDAWMRFVTLPQKPFWILIGIGLLATYLPYMLYGAGLKRLDTGRASILATIEPVVSIVLAGALWHEWFSLAGYIFAAMVLAGVIATH